MKKTTYLFFVIYFTLLTSPLFAEVPAVDAVYRNNIKTVRIYPAGADVLTQAIVSINRELILEFDEISDEANNYYIKVIHCNADWQPSNLRSLQYMKDFNEVFIQNRQFSTSTKVEFTHYSVHIPPVTVSGNFFVKVFEEGNEDNVVLTRRFMVVENYIDIVGEIAFANNTSKRLTHQMVNFTIAYPRYNIVNPSVQLKVVVRQNFTWQSATPPLVPLYIREDSRLLEYTYYRDETTFPGGNEYRFFDMRSFNFSGFNVGRIIRHPKSTEVILAIDNSRASNMYILWEDLNGRYTNENYETGGTKLEPDYAKVRFTLEAEELSNADVYVYGELSNWELAPGNRMKYNKERKSYENELYLKQGVYNYRYFVKGRKTSVDENYFEGSFSATENVYDIIVYYRVPGEFFDRIVGYHNMRYQGR